MILRPPDSTLTDTLFPYPTPFLSQAQRMERELGVTAETLALFVRFWLTITPPLPNDDQGAAQIKGRERFDGFIEALGRRLQKGQSFLREIPDDIGGVPSIDDADDPGRKSE